MKMKSSLCFLKHILKGGGGGPATCIWYRADLTNVEMIFFDSFFLMFWWTPLPQYWLNDYTAQRGWNRFCSLLTRRTTGNWSNELTCKLEILISLTAAIMLVWNILSYDSFLSGGCADAAHRAVKTGNAGLRKRNKNMKGYQHCHDKFTNYLVYQGK